MAEALQTLMGYQGTVRFDASKPNGTMRKLLDNSKLRALGWREQVSWEDGLRDAYQWYVSHAATEAEKV